MNILDLAKKSKQASREFFNSSADNRNKALIQIGKKLIQREGEILEANAKDVNKAEKDDMSPALVDRLRLTSERINIMSQAATDIANQEEVVGKIIQQQKMASGIRVKKERVPLGVIAMIFESRPNVVIDCSCLAIKSGNAMILKGGKEAAYSNQILTEIVQDSIAGLLPENLVQLIDTREQVADLIGLSEYLDVVIPRGGEKLIQYVYENSSVPVIAHFQGLCHIYIHEDANLSTAKSIVLNAKVQRPGTCNSVECLLIDQKLDDRFCTELLKALQTENVELRVSGDLSHLLDDLKIATDEDYSTEHLDKILSVKRVAGINGAIAHIHKYGTHHTEGIIAKDKNVIDQFRRSVDASCITVNASTRFNDGGELGLGAELGISTSKFHAYGPMGAEEMTTTRFLVEGSGQIRK